MVTDHAIKVYMYHKRIAKIYPIRNFEAPLLERKLKGKVQIT